MLDRRCCRRQSMPSGIFFSIFLFLQLPLLSTLIYRTLLCGRKAPLSRSVIPLPISQYTLRCVQRGLLICNTSSENTSHERASPMAVLIHHVNGFHNAFAPFFVTQIMILTLAVSSGMPFFLFLWPCSGATIKPMSASYDRNHPSNIVSEGNSIKQTYYASED
jgi:hypothetical protein